MSATTSARIGIREAQRGPVQRGTHRPIARRKVVGWTVAVVVYLVMAAALFCAPRAIALIKSHRRTDVNYVDAGTLHTTFARMAHSAASRGGAFSPDVDIATPDVRSVHVVIVGP